MMLSKRILDYDSHRTRWVCSESSFDETDGWAYEDLNYDRSYTAYSSFHRLLRKRKPPAFNSTASRHFWQAYKEWHSIREQYTKRLLSYPTDRLPAIAALAQTLEQYLGTYTAGLWNKVLALELLWKSARPRLAPRPTEYICPTWSWPSINCPVYNTAPLFDSDSTDERYDDADYNRLADPRSEDYDSDFDDDRRFSWFPNTHKHFRVLECSAATMDPTFPFGEIAASPRAVLTIEAPARTAMWHPRAREGGWDTQQLAALHNPADGRYVPARFLVDCIPSGSWDGGPTEVVLALFTEEYDESWYGIVVRPRPGEEDVYERLGMFHLHWACGLKDLISGWGYEMYVQEAQWAITGDVRKFTIV
jgi:hypothetical protein